MSKLTNLAEPERTSYVLALEALLRQRLGQREHAQALCEAVEARREPGRPVAAAARLALGDTDRAVALLERLEHERSGLLVFCGCDDLFAGLPAEPRTAAILARVGIPLG